MAAATVDQVASGSVASPGLDRARSAVVWLLLLELAVLALTGVYLFFEYRPTAPGVPRALYDPDARRAIDAVRIHQVAAWAAAATGVVAAVLLLLRPGRFHWRRLVHAVSLPVLALAGLGTGMLLPWDQLALWAVTVGTNLDGYELLGGDDVRFVLQGGSEVSPATLLRVLFVHVVVIAVPLTGLTALALRRGRRPAGRADDATA